MVTTTVSYSLTCSYEDRQTEPSRAEGDTTRYKHLQLRVEVDDFRNRQNLRVVL